MRISDWSSDVCSSDLAGAGVHVQRDLALEHQVAFHHRIGSDHDARLAVAAELDRQPGRVLLVDLQPAAYVRVDADGDVAVDGLDAAAQLGGDDADRAVDRFDALGDVAAAADEDAAVDRLDAARSEEHTSELQSLMRISYAVLGLKKKISPLLHKTTTSK